jgi:hypothetical protein
MILTIAEIVDALRISRSEFGRIFVQVQMETLDNPALRKQEKRKYGEPHPGSSER